MHPDRPRGRSRQRLLAGAIVCATVAAYWPAFHAGFVWDDDAHVVAGSEFASADGLRRIWLEPGATQQYYPVVYTSFWLEQFVWGSDAAGYHVVNVLLHATNAVLLGLLLARLAVPGAWLAAAVFALHPVHVESVAWVSERKNVLSAFFYLASLLVWLRYRALAGRSGAAACYAAAFGLFVLAALSKTVVVSLPAAMLLLVWWREGRIGRADVVPLLPFFVVGAAFGLLTLAVEQGGVGAFGPEWDLSPTQRLLIAARVPWFYLSKLVWPANLSFIYPRWQIDPSDPWPYLYLLATLAVITGLWAARGRIGRGPLAAVLFFGGTLFPALGFFDVYPFLFSFVADHFQYLASAGLIALGAAGLARAAERTGALPSSAAAVALLALLATLVHWQASTYHDPETLWRATIERNPEAWLAHHNLGVAHFAAGREDLGMAAFDRAIALRPGYADAYNNRGTAWFDRGEYGRAIEDFSRAVAAQPDHVLALTNRGAAYRRIGRPDLMLADFLRVVAFAPEDPGARLNLGNAYHLNGNDERAVAEYSRALESLPGNAFAWASRCDALRALGRTEDALRDCDRAVAIAPDDGHARLTRARVFEALGQTERARADREAAERRGYRD